MKFLLANDDGKLDGMVALGRVIAGGFGSFG
jgi:hypothetical protein